MRWIAILAAAMVLAAGPQAWPQGAAAGLRGPLGPRPPGSGQARPDAPAKASGPLVQIGIFRSRAIVAERWKALVRAYPKDMAGRSLRVRQGIFGGRTGYKSFVAGFPTRLAASRLCAKFRSRGHDCFVVP
jgi:hypothetical protein